MPRSPHLEQSVVAAAYWTALVKTVMAHCGGGDVSLVHGILIWLGMTNPSGMAYSFWSGIGSDIGEFAIAAVLWRHINCPVKGCWRPAVRKVPGTDHRACGKHHPEGPLTHIRLLADHKRGTST